MKSEAFNIDRYTGGKPAQQFDFLYESFSILRELLKDYREDLITEVIEQKSYNRRSQNGDLGVRVQVSMGVSNPTQNQAIEHMTIAQAIDNGLLDDDFFEDTDDSQELIHKVTCYHRVTEDFEVFNSKLGTMYSGYVRGMNKKVIATETKLIRKLLADKKEISIRELDEKQENSIRLKE